MDKSHSAGRNFVLRSGHRIDGGRMVSGRQADALLRSDRLRWASSGRLSAWDVDRHKSK